jgi:hypothetical protein
MDLPSCPSCHQSVLDDDAEVCPFCGAPMKAGAAAKPIRATAKPSAPAAAAPRSTARPESKTGPGAVSKPAVPAGKPSAPNKSAKPATTPTPAARSAPRPAKPEKSKSLSEDDLFGDDLDFDSPSSPGAPAAPPVDDGGDPLEVKSTAGRDAIPASRQRTKSRTQKITCPMCETIGYIPANAAGKDVRCANPKCLVPVFVAPRLQKKVEETKSSKSGSQTVLLLVIGLLFAATASGGWYFYNRPAAPPEKKGPPQWKFRQTDENPAGKNAQDEKPVPPPVAAETQLILAQECDPVLEVMQRYAESRDRNLRPPYCRRVVAHTAADCGKLELAQKYVGLLAQGKRDLAFYQIAPLTSLAWQHLKKGDQAAAGKSLDQAMKAAGNIPTMGRDSIDFSVALASALVAVGRDQEAKELVARFPASGPNGRLVTVMTTAANWNTWDTVAAENERPLFDLPSLQCPLVVEIAVAHGRAAQALHFAESLENPSERAQTLIAWGEAVARAQAQANSSDLSSIEPVIAKLEPANRARLQARLGSERVRASDRGGAEKYLTAAIASVGEIPTPKEFTLPSARKLAAFEFHDRAQARLNSLALAEVARLEGMLEKRTDAQRHLELALAVLRASAPNTMAAKQMVEEAGRLRSTEFEGAIPSKGRKEAIALAKRRNQEQARAALAKAREMSKVLAAAAESRFDLQKQILASALAWDDGAHIWQIIGANATSADPYQKEPYFETSIPWQLLFNLRKSGDAATAETINKAAGNDTPPPTAVLELLAQKVAEADDVSSIARQMQFPGPDRSDRERAVLAGSTYLLRAGKVAKAVEFVRMFDDSQLKEETLEWTAALSCRLNHTRETKEILQAASFIPTEAVSAYRGFLLGLLARDLAPESAPSTAAAGPPQRDVTTPKP